MRGWGAIAGLGGAVLLLALVAMPGRGDPAALLPPQSVDVRGAGARVARAEAAAGVAAAVRAQPLGPRRAAVPADAPAADGLGDAIERQRSAMRAAVMLLVAAEATPPDAR